MKITRKEALALSRKILLDAEKGRQIDALANSSFDIIHDALETVELLNEMGNHDCGVNIVIKWSVVLYGGIVISYGHDTPLGALREAKEKGWKRDE